MKNLIRTAKKILYFKVALYFSFFAAIYLKRWKPTVITVTGSSGKTTLLHLLEAQIGHKAIYSHKANSTFGIPFHILGLERKTYKVSEWFIFFVLAPFRAFRKVRPEKIYVTEVDAERPGEAHFVAKLLKPDALIWLSLEEAHGVNFDALVKEGSEDNRDILKKKIAGEFGYLIERPSTIILNKDNHYIIEQARRTQAEITYVSEKDITSFDVKAHSVEMQTTAGKFRVPFLIPKNASLSVFAVATLLKKLDFPIDPDFKNFNLPPGRSSILVGKKDVTIIDSSYNATFDGMKAMLDLIKRYPAAGEKWLVLGDMIEQGKSEELQHKELAAMIKDVAPSRIVLIGPRLMKNTFPTLSDTFGSKVVAYLMPREGLKYLEREIKGGETVLFKGARFLEGIVEQLLEDPADVSKLCRREAVWVKRRKEWGL